MDNVATIISSIAAVTGVITSIIIYRGQKSLLTRQQVITLWQYMAKLNDINPAVPVATDVIDTANTLELIALCCEGGMVDEKVIKRTFREQFIKHYESIKKCPIMPGINKDGEGVLKENRAAIQFYNKLIDEVNSHDKLNK